MALSDKISLFIERQVPAFVRDEHPLFVKFLQAYYEWLESGNRPAARINTIAENRDIDRTADEFVNWFTLEYLAGVPGNIIANKRLLIKHIKDFYLAKGTEKSYEFLFNILFGQPVSVFYPSTAILRASDGKWQADKVIWTNGANPDFASFNSTLLTGQHSGAVAIIESSRQFVLSGIDVTEYVISSSKNRFIADETVISTSDDGQFFLSEQVFSLVTGIRIISTGTGYSVGDTFTVFNSNIGSNGTIVGRGTVTSILNGADSGPIASCQMTEFGISDGTEIVDFSGSGNGDATAVALTGTMPIYPGHWLNTDGQLSSDKVLQDNFFYQDFSYVLRSTIPFDDYKDIILKAVHPAGMLLFGQAIQDDTQSTITQLDFTLDISSVWSIYVDIEFDFNLILSSMTNIDQITYDATQYYQTYGAVPPGLLFGEDQFTIYNNPYYPDLYKATSSTVLIPPIPLNIGIYTTDAEIVVGALNNEQISDEEGNVLSDENGTDLIIED